jgi:hypothetical protein
LYVLDQPGPLARSGMLPGAQPITRWPSRETLAVAMAWTGQREPARLDRDLPDNLSATSPSSSPRRYVTHVAARRPSRCRWPSIGGTLPPATAGDQEIGPDGFPKPHPGSTDPAT